MFWKDCTRITYPEVLTQPSTEVTQWSWKIITLIQWKFQWPYHVNSNDSILTTPPPSISLGQWPAVAPLAQIVQPVP